MVIRKIQRSDGVIQRYHIKRLAQFNEKYKYDRGQRAHRLKVERITPLPPPPPEKGLFRISFSVRFSYIGNTRHDYYLDLNGVIVSDTTDKSILRSKIISEAISKYSGEEIEWALANASKIDVVITSIERTRKKVQTRMEVIKLQRL